MACTLIACFGRLVLRDDMHGLRVSSFMRAWCTSSRRLHCLLACRPDPFAVKSGSDEERQLLRRCGAQ
eukprot:7053212-Prymnesium_polylepis.1